MLVYQRVLLLRFNQSYQSKSGFYWCIMYMSKSDVSMDWLERTIARTAAFYHKTNMVVSSKLSLHPFLATIPTWRDMSVELISRSSRCPFHLIHLNTRYNEVGTAHNWASPLLPDIFKTSSKHQTWDWKIVEHDLSICSLIHIIYVLVGGFNHLEKYERQFQWEGLSHIWNGT